MVLGLDAKFGEGRSEVLRDLAEVKHLSERGRFPGCFSDREILRIQFLVVQLLED